MSDIRAPGKDPLLLTGEQTVCTLEPVWTQCETQIAGATAQPVAGHSAD